MRLTSLPARILLLSLLFLIVPVSCKKTPARNGRTATLRDKAVVQERGIEWSDDVFGMDEAKAAAFSVSPVLEQLPLAHIAAYKFDGKAGVFPFLEGFASLDTSDYSDASFAALDGFCLALEEGKGEDSFMDRGFLYTLALFKYQAGFSGKRKAVSHVIGSPILKEGENASMQCPVRFVLSDGDNCDVYVYLVKSVSDWKINQIDFMKEKTEEGL
ncbi:MAG: hypothetical protein IJU95_03025 [Treponema sp.]|nr:hypothetical protein [Treponema sp.]